MKSISYIFVILLVSLIFSFCNKQKKDTENALLEEYIAQYNEDEIIRLEDGGIYIIKSGFSTPETLETDDPTIGDTIVSIYKGYLLSNPETVFDEVEAANPQRYAFREDNVIAGWELAMAEMKIDETAKIIIHSDYAYKGDQVGLIPPYSSLIYEVRILTIIKNQ